MTDVRMPDGAIVRFPDTMPADQIGALIRQKFPQMTKAREQPNVLQDMGQQALAGIPRGAADVAGLPADLINLGTRGVVAGLNKITGQNKEAQVPDWIKNLGSQGIRNWASEKTGITLPEPKTWQGAIAGKATEFGTGAILAGPGAIARSALKEGAGAAVRQAARTGLQTGVVPGVVSEGLGQLTEASGEPQWLADLMRMGGGLAGAGIAGLKPKMFAPTLKNLDDHATQLYKQAKDMGVVVTNGSGRRMAQAVQDAFAKSGSSVGESLNPGSAAALKEIRASIGSGQSLTLDELERLRRVINNAGAKITEPVDVKIAADMRHAFDDYLGTISLKDVSAISGNPAIAVGILKEARRNWTLKSKGDALQNLMDRAELSPSWRAGDKANAITAEFRAFSKNKNEMRFFTPFERRAIKNAVLANRPEAIFRWLQRFSGVSNPRTAGFGAGVGGGLGFLAGGPAGAVVGSAIAPVFGEVGRLTGNAIAMRDANIASAIVKGGRVQRPPGLFPIGGIYAESLYNNQGQR